MDLPAHRVADLCEIAVVESCWGEGDDEVSEGKGGLIGAVYGLSRQTAGLATRPMIQALSRLLIELVGEA